jgi:hypothetical protein
VVSAASSAGEELLATLGRAEAAMSGGDKASANQAMTAAADLCRRLQAEGRTLPDGELAAVRELFARCGRELARLEHELNLEGFRGDNHRRGINSYRAAMRR